jgi:outer membrane protein assembly factor BamB
MSNRPSSKLRSGVAILTLVLGVLASAPGQSLGNDRCTIVGSRRADVLHGTDHSDVICGLGGPDRLYAEGGDDVLIGGAGNDILVGRDGDDMLLGGLGADQGAGGRGDDGCAVETRDTTCESTWLARFDDPKHLSDEGRFIAISPSGDTLFVGGFSERTNDEPGSLINDPDHDFQVLAYATGSGRLRWSAVADGPAGGYDRMSAIEVAIDGSAVFVTGTMSSSDPYTADEMTTIAFDADTGQRLWTRAIDSTNDYTSFASDLAVDPAGALVYVCGGIDGAAVVVALDTSSGQEQWRGSTAAPLYASCGSVDVRADGSSVAMGGEWNTGDSSTGQDLMASFATTDGHLVWKRTPDTAGVEDLVQDVRIGPDGTVYAMSSTLATNGYRSELFALAPATGTTNWTSTYTGPGPAMISCARSSPLWMDRRSMPPGSVRSPSMSPTW